MAVELRDGKRCVVKVEYPEIQLYHSNVYQADHCFTRGNKHLFLVVANGTMVCSSCNRAKHYDNKSVKRAVDYIVQKREGESKWNEMLAIDMGKSANSNWHKVWWLEEQRDRLRKEVVQYGGIPDWEILPLGFSVKEVSERPGEIL